MAKIFYSALVNTIAGKLLYGVLSRTKGISYLKSYNPTPTDRRTQRQVQVRSQISYLAGQWYLLSSTLKDLWNDYAAAHPDPQSGINAYIGVNQRLMYYFGSGARRTAPPPTPDTPEHPQGTNVLSLGAMDFCVTWTRPTDPNTFTAVNYRPVLGIERTASLQWKFGGTAGGDKRSIRINTDYPHDYRVKFRVRSLDLLGRASPWSHVHDRGPSFAGRYGYSSYGYSYYGP